MRKKYIIDKKIGARIQETRKKRGITQEVLAEKVNISSAQEISNIERGIRGLSLHNFKEICKELKIESDYLLFGIEARTVETQLAKYLDKMTDEQTKTALELVKVYAKSCGIGEN